LALASVIACQGGFILASKIVGVLLLPALIGFLLALPAVFDVSDVLLRTLLGGELLENFAGHRIYIFLVRKKLSRVLHALGVFKP
jgi:hypothetical protein